MRAFAFVRPCDHRAWMRRKKLEGTSDTLTWSLPP